MFLLVEYQYKDIHGVYFLDYSLGVWSSDSEELNTVERTVPYSGTSCSDDHRTADSITDWERRVWEGLQEELSPHPHCCQSVE